MNDPHSAGFDLGVANGERSLDQTLDESYEVLISRQTMWEWTAAEAA